MSAKYYCDRCQSELKKHEGDRLKVSIGKFTVEVMHCAHNVWNSGNLCWKCVREIVAKGKPAK